jgi:ABC-type phosphate/phosphonate transport system permease subunit
MDIKPKHIQPIIMAGIMACLMTGFVTWLNLGFPNDYFTRWMRAFVMAWPIAACAAFLAIPLSVKLTAKFLNWLGQ